MEQMKMDNLEQVSIDFEIGLLPKAVRELRPAVFKDGVSYCAILGPDPQEGIFGCGDTPQDALEDWNVHLMERIASPAQNDTLAQEVIDNLNMRKKDVW